MKTFPTLKQITAFFIVKNNIQPKANELPVELIDYLMDLYNTRNLTNYCIVNIDLARLALNDNLILERLGKHYSKQSLVQKTRSYISSFWYSPKKTNIQHEINKSHAGYLFQILESHKELYDECLNREDIMERLSDYQKGALRSHYNGKHR